jgi:hypothetical protein
MHMRYVIVEINNNKDERTHAMTIQSYLLCSEENNLPLPGQGVRPAMDSEHFFLNAISLISIPLVIIVDGLDKVVNR